MINYNNHNIAEIHYDSHDIKYVYGCDGRLVWKNTPRTYFRFKAVDTGTFKMTGKIQYSIDGGMTWPLLDANTPSPTIQAGDYIWWKRNTQGGTRGIGTFSSTGRFEAEGNIMSLIVADAFVDDGEYLGQRTFEDLFKGCTGLTSAENIILPNTVISGCYSEMFSGCTSLTNMPDLPAMTLAEDCYNSMFYGCTSLRSVKKLPATQLADVCYHMMFMGCTSLTSVPYDMLPATTLTYLCYGMMFKDCVNLTKAPMLPATSRLLTYSYNAMFAGCSKLNEITCLTTDISAPQCTTSWVRGVSPTGTFYKNASMSSWTIGNNGIPTGWVVKDYNPQFQGKWLATYRDGHTQSAECDSTSAITQNEIPSTNIKTLQIGDCVKTIGYMTMVVPSYSGFTSLIIGNNVEIIGQQAFAGNEGLTSLIIPNSVREIGAAAFATCTSVTSLTIGNSVETIGQTAFGSCSGLTSVTIPNSVTTIERTAFRYCVNLTSVTCLATNPPALGLNAFEDTNNCPIYVPAESVDAYKSATNWSSYASRIFPIQ